MDRNDSRIVFWRQSTHR